MEEARIPRKNSHWSSINIYLFTNGQNYLTPPRKYHLNENDLASWDKTLENIGCTLLSAQYNNVTLYTLNGVSVSSPLELEDGVAYVAVSRKDTFIDAGYNNYMMKASRSWEKRQGGKTSMNINDKTSWNPKIRVATTKTSERRRLLNLSTQGCDPGTFRLQPIINAKAPSINVKNPGLRITNAKTKSENRVKNQDFQNNRKKNVVKPSGPAPTAHKPITRPGPSPKTIRPTRPRKIINQGIRSETVNSEVKKNDAKDALVEIYRKNTKSLLKYPVVEEQSIEYKINKQKSQTNIIKTDTDESELSKFLTAIVGSKDSLTKLNAHQNISKPKDETVTKTELLQNVAQPNNKFNQLKEQGVQTSLTLSPENVGDNINSQITNGFLEKLAAEANKSLLKTEENKCMADEYIPLCFQKCCDKCIYIPIDRIELIVPELDINKYYIIIPSHEKQVDWQTDRGLVLRPKEQVDKLAKNTCPMATHSVPNTKESTPCITYTKMTLKLKQNCDKSTQTEWYNVVLEVKKNDDGKYIFYMPTLENLKNLSLL